MDFESLLNNQRKSYFALAKNFVKEDIQYITNKANFNEKKVDVFRRRYYQRKKLVTIGPIIYGYVIRVIDDFDNRKPQFSWVIFSPMSEYEKNPANYEKVMQNLNKIIESQSIPKAYKRLKIMLSEKYSEPQYFQIPIELTEGKIVYLSFVNFWRNKNPNLKPGIIPIFMNQTISKEILYLPEKYWIDDIKKVI